MLGAPCDSEARKASLYNLSETQSECSLSLKWELDEPEKEDMSEVHQPWHHDFEQLRKVQQLMGAKLAALAEAVAGQLSDTKLVSSLSSTRERTTQADIIEVADGKLSDGHSVSLEQRIENLELGFQEVRRWCPESSTGRVLSMQKLLGAEAEHLDLVHQQLLQIRDALEETQQKQLASLASEKPDPMASETLPASIAETADTTDSTVDERSTEMTERKALCKNNLQQVGQRLLQLRQAIQLAQKKCVASSGPENSSPIVCATLPVAMLEKTVGDFTLHHATLPAELGQPCTGNRFEDLVGESLHPFQHEQSVSDEPEKQPQQAPAHAPESDITQHQTVTIATEERLNERIAAQLSQALQEVKCAAADNLKKEVAQALIDAMQEVRLHAAGTPGSEIITELTKAAQVVKNDVADALKGDIAKELCNATRDVKCDVAEALKKEIAAELSEAILAMRNDSAEAWKRTSTAELREAMQEVKCDAAEALKNEISSELSKVNSETSARIDVLRQDITGELSKAIEGVRCSQQQEASDDLRAFVDLAIDENTKSTIQQCITEQVEWAKDALVLHQESEGRAAAESLRRELAEELSRAVQEVKDACEVPDASASGRAVRQKKPGLRTAFACFRAQRGDSPVR